MTHQGAVQACCHIVKYWYKWDGRRAKVSRSLLEEEAEQRAKDCIIEGYCEGELNCLTPNSQEVRGWWAIERGTI
jgi:hypothetical protein